MKSKKHLFVALDKFFNTDKYTKGGLKAVYNETYGKRSMIYVDTAGSDVRVQLESFLKTEGFGVNKDYHIGSGTLEVRVSYFRGHQWNV